MTALLTFLQFVHFNVLASCFTLTLPSIRVHGISSTDTRFPALWPFYFKAAAHSNDGNRHNELAIENSCRNGFKDRTDFSEDDVNNCYRLAVIISAVVLVLQFLSMCLFGWVNHQYLDEMKEEAAVAAVVELAQEVEA
jgi:hypothetical protein